MAEDDDLVLQLRRALAVNRVGASPAAEAEMVRSKPAATEDGPAAPRSAPIGAAALGIADELLGYVPTYELPVEHVELALRRGGAIYTVPTTGLVLGRRVAPGALVIDDRHVSREHARVVDVDGALLVVDVGSSNGTAILRGGSRIDVGNSAVALQPGDRIVTVNDVELVDVIDPTGRGDT